LTQHQYHNACTKQIKHGKLPQPTKSMDPLSVSIHTSMLRFCINIFSVTFDGPSNSTADLVEIEATLHELVGSHVNDTRSSTPYKTDVTQKRHAGGKPYHCPTCGRGFVFNWQMIRHKRVHTGEKPYACTYCEYRTARKDALKMHHTRNHLQQFLSDSMDV